MQNNFDATYHNMLNHILLNGVERKDRTGVGTCSIFGGQMRFDLREGFPLITTKKIHTKSIFAELLWFLSGETNVKKLQEQNVSIWDEWADAKGELGPIYGAQWRAWGSHNEITRPIDQISQVIEDIQSNPFSRRHIVSAWNVADIPDMAIPPCHTLFQFYVHPDDYGNPKSLSCHLYQRSADFFLGVPFNIASYALLTEMVAKVTNLGVRDFVHSFGDAHIYSNHFKQVIEQLRRSPTTPPRLVLSKKASVFDYELADINVVGYNPHPPISAPVAI